MLIVDAIYSLEQPLTIHSPRVLALLARALFPVVTKVPQTWFYPTGAKQETSVRGPGTRYYGWADVIAGDFHYLRRSAPKRLDGKTLLTTTTTEADVAWARAAGVRRMITTTPRVEGRSFATNTIEALLIALAGERTALTGPAYLELLRRAEIRPDVQDLHT